MQELFQNLVSEFGQMCGIPNLSPNGNGELKLLFDRTLSVSIMATPTFEELLIYSVVGHDAARSSTKLMLQLLNASLFGRSTNGSTFAIDDLADQIILQRIEPIVGMTYQEFEHLLEQFVNAVEFWSHRIQESENSHCEMSQNPTLSDSDPKTKLTP